MTLTLGVDVGSAAVKCVLLNTENRKQTIQARHVERIRRRTVTTVVDEALAGVLEAGRVTMADVEYLATTGEGDLVQARKGHFYGMTCHARGALWLLPQARACLDVGALHARAILMDERGKVLGYKMTSQCASGSGQFVENIARYLGVPLEEVGERSKEAKNPEAVSSICAVLAETDVINMVSRGISTPDILKGIHLSMAGRFAKLLKGAGAAGLVLLTGGMALDQGLLAALQEEIDKQKLGLMVQAHEDSILAGALGAAIWGEFRLRKLKAREAAPTTSGA